MSDPTPAMIKARESLPEDQWPMLDAMVGEYKFACLKHHGSQLVSPRVIAELIKMGWRST